MLDQTRMRPYAEAAFAQAQEEDRVLLWRSWLRSLAAAVAPDDIQLLLSNPFLDQPAVVALLASLWPDSLSATQHAFLSLLLERRCLAAVAGMVTCFEALYCAYAHVQPVSLETAFPLSDEALSRLTTIFQEQLGAQIEWTVTLCPALMGGILVRIGDDVIDASVRGRMAQLSHALA